MSTDPLPLPEYDHLPIGSLRHRIRSLDLDRLATLIGHEREHGDRAPVLRILIARLDQLRDGAEQSDGRHGVLPEIDPMPGGSAVLPADPPPDDTPARHV